MWLYDTKSVHATPWNVSMTRFIFTERYSNNYDKLTNFKLIGCSTVAGKSLQSNINNSSATHYPTQSHTGPTVKARIK